MTYVLVTGCAGFLGFHLCERLLSEWHEVICLDNFFAGTKENVLHLIDTPHFEMTRYDDTSPFYIKFEDIYSLACPASPNQYQVQTAKVGVHGEINLLSLARLNIARIFNEQKEGSARRPPLSESVQILLRMYFCLIHLFLTFVRNFKKHIN